MSKKILKNLKTPLTIELILENNDPKSTLRSSITKAIDNNMTSESKTSHLSLKYVVKPCPYELNRISRVKNVRIEISIYNKKVN